MTQTGQTVQIAAVALYADGSVQDVSAAASGNQYWISNPQLASVSADGLVTALQSGTVLLQAVNEGAQGLLSLSVALTGDFTAATASATRTNWRPAPTRRTPTATAISAPPPRPTARRASCQRTAQGRGVGQCHAMARHDVGRTGFCSYGAGRG